MVLSLFVLLCQFLIQTMHFSEVGFEGSHVSEATCVFRLHNQRFHQGNGFGNGTCELQTTEIESLQLETSSDPFLPQYTVYLCKAILKLCHDRREVNLRGQLCDAKELTQVLQKCSNDLNIITRQRHLFNLSNKPFSYDKPFADCDWAQRQ